jgi:hypothetical protein
MENPRLVSRFILILILAIAVGATAAVIFYWKSG